MTDRVKNDPSLSPPDGPQLIERPILIVHKLNNGNEGYFLDLSRLDPKVDDPRHFGVLLSDLLDQIAGAYSQAMGADQAVLRKHLKKVMCDEDLFKERDPSRYKLSRGTIQLPPKH